MSIRHIITTILSCFLISSTAYGETLRIDSIDAVEVSLADSIELADTYMPDSIMVAQLDSAQINRRDSIFQTLPWYRQLMENGFQIHDPRISYPKFPKFCLDVYDWGDRTFNSYDPKYVVATGKNWKVMLKNYNWLTSYMMFFEKNQRLNIRSDIYQDIGAYICFMAVSLGYTAKVDNLIGHARKTRENFNVSFTSSLIYGSFNYWNTTDVMTITRFGDYNDGKYSNIEFDDLTMSAASAEIYYFGNHLKYSQAAAYCFSKYQLKSAGSWIAGLSFNHHTLNMDFTNLSPDIKVHLPELRDYYKFKYNDYDLLAGYAYNWVLQPKTWLINATVLPSIGLRCSYSDSSVGRSRSVSTNLRAMFSVVYNRDTFFATLQGRFDGSVYYDKQYTLFDTINSLSLIIGARF